MIMMMMMNDSDDDDNGDDDHDHDEDAWTLQFKPFVYSFSCLQEEHHFEC